MTGKASELTPGKESVINIDCIQRGVGTGSCGPQTLEKYVVNPGEYNFKYTITPDNLPEKL